MTDKTHVPDKLEGYMLQTRYALYNLITLDDYIVSIEAFDDVAIETETTITAEQIKSVSSDNNPVANKAVAFWKTLYNWCQYFEDGTFSSKKTVLGYIIISSHLINIGEIPQSFSDAKSNSEAKIALTSARDIIYPSLESEPDISDECKKYVQYCFDIKNENTVLMVISLMSITVYGNTFDDELRMKFYKQIIPKEYADVLFLSMLGWTQDKIHQFTKNNKAAYISSQEYRDALLREIRGRNTQNILSAISSQPSDVCTKVEVTKRDTYIKQLQLINADDLTIFKAASDFLRTKAEKTMWAERGLVNEQNFEDYNDTIIRMWENEKFIIELNPCTNKESMGQHLYRNSLQNVLKLPLQGCSVPAFFGSGSLQNLANEPKVCPEIGWHPEYKKILNNGD